jgi:hypothetical protein
MPAAIWLRRNLFNSGGLLIGLLILGLFFLGNFFANVASIFAKIYAWFNKEPAAPAATPAPVTPLRTGESWYEPVWKYITSIPWWVWVAVALMLLLVVILRRSRPRGAAPAVTRPWNPAWKHIGTFIIWFLLFAAIFCGGLIGFFKQGAIGFLMEYWSQTLTTLAMLALAVCLKSNGIRFVLVVLLISFTLYNMGVGTSTVSAPSFLSRLFGNTTYLKPGDRHTFKREDWDSKVVFEQMVPGAPFSILLAPHPFWVCTIFENLPVDMRIKRKPSRFENVLEFEVLRGEGDIAISLAGAPNQNAARIEDAGCSRSPQIN